MLFAPLDFDEFAFELGDAQFLLCRLEFGFNPLSLQGRKDWSSTQQREHELGDGEPRQQSRDNEFQNWKEHN